MYDNYLARLAQAEEAGLTWNELMVLAKVSGGPAFIHEDALRASDLVGDLRYSISKQYEMSREDRQPQTVRELIDYPPLDSVENWGVDSEELLSKLCSLPPDVLGALGVRADLYWVDGSPAKKKNGGNGCGQFFVGDPVAVTSKGLKKYFKMYGFAYVSAGLTTATPANSIFLEIYFGYLKEFHPKEALTYWCERP
jgi:hypothetical protein